MAIAQIRAEVQNHPIKQRHTNFAKSHLFGPGGVFPGATAKKKRVLFAPAFLRKSERSVGFFDGDEFDLDQIRRADQRRDLECRPGRLVRLRRGPKFLEPG